MRPRLVSFLAICLLAGPLAAADLVPRLVKDINTGFATSSGDPTDYVTIGGLTYFTADDGDTGGELWRTDGTPGGTYRLTDICPGVCSSFPTNYAASDHSNFFIAFAADRKATLWVTSGTPATTFDLASVGVAEPTAGANYRWAPGLGLLFFSATDGLHGYELWRSDGTPGGTYQVTDLMPGAQGSNPREMTVFKNRLYYVADDPRLGPVLWKSDGTPQGTQMVFDPAPRSAAHVAPADLRVAGPFLYFVAPTPSHGIELWKSDGTTRGTAPLTDLVPGAGSPVFGEFDFFPLGNRLLFVANDGKNGQELWATDGTARGTQRLTNFAPVRAFHGPGGFVEFSQIGNRLVFPVNDGVHGTEFWTTDGTQAGTTLLKDVCPGTCSNFVDFLTPPFGNHALFAGYDPVHGVEPWITDGTPAGTHLLRDLCNGSCNSVAVPYLYSGGSQAFFVTQDPDGILRKVWRTDGTARGTRQVADVRSLLTPPRGSFSGTILGNTLIFSADDGVHGNEVWRSDGTVQGTGLLADTNSHNIASSIPSEITAVGNGVFFLAYDGSSATELWKSDGTGAGTSLVHDFSSDPGLGPDPTSGFTRVAAGNRLVFTLRSSSGRGSLWGSDGTDGGTLRLTADDLRSAGDFCAVGGTAFFVSTDEDYVAELWKTDGTPAGTVRVSDVEPSRLTAFQGKLYFVGGSSDRIVGLWMSDGTETGTRLVKEVSSDPEVDPNFNSLTVVGNRLWFFAAPDGFHQQLWSTDGTEAGTVPADLGALQVEGIVSDGTRLLLSGHTSDTDEGLWLSDGTAAGTRRLGAFGIDNSAGGPVTLGGEMYFSASPVGSFRFNLWKSDGTEAGTMPVLDPTGFEPDFLQVFAGRLVFTNSQGDLWQSDGTPAGTVKLRDLAGPGESGDDGWPLVAAGSRLFFRSADPATGEELWALDPP